MGASRLPSWRFIIPMLAAIAVIAALTTLTMKSSRPSVLIQDKAALAPTAETSKAPEELKKALSLPQIPGMGKPGAKPDAGAEKAAADRMFKYLSKESYTPDDEKRYLAKQLGVKATQKPDIWTLPNGQTLKNSDDAARSSSLNVPYFSTELLPQAKPIPKRTSSQADAE